MIDLHDEILVDFIAEAEDYYQSVQQATGQIQAGQVQEGISALLRPLHTIKGTSGFIAGLDKLKTYTHQVEDILKAIQNSAEPLAAPAVEAVIRAVDEVFNLLEQVKGGSTELDDAQAQATLAGLQQELSGGGKGATTLWFPPRVIVEPGLGAAGAAAAGGEVRLTIRDGVLFLGVNAGRLHLAWQCSPLVAAIAQADPRLPIVIDLSAVRTISSTAWGEIWQTSMDRQVALLGLRPAVEATYASWGLAARMRAYADEAAFWADRRGAGQSAGGSA